MARPSLSALSASRPPAGDLFTWDWNSTTTPAGLSITRSGTVLCISNAGQSTVQSFGADTWDYEIASDGTIRVWFVPTYTNLLTGGAAVNYSGSDGNWTASAGSYNSFAGTGPDGTTLSGNHRATLTSGQTGAYYSYGSDTKLVFSAWCRAPSGSSTWYPALEHGSNPLYNVPGAFAVTTAWTRGVLYSNATGGARYAVPCESAAAAGSHAQDVVVDRLMVVQGIAYAPPYTAGTAGSKFVSTPASNLVNASGYWDVSITGVVTLVDEATDIAGTSDRWICCLDPDDGENNGLKISGSTGHWILRVDGTDVLDVNTGYGPNDMGEIRFWSRADSCGFEVPGLDSPHTAAAQPAIAVPSGNAVFFSDGKTDASCWPVQVYGADVSAAPCVARRV